MVFKWEIKGFDLYLISEEGHILRKEYVTKHKHYKSPRFISSNSRNQFRLWRNGKQEVWSKRQLRTVLTPIKPIQIANSCKLKELPF